MHVAIKFVDHPSPPPHRTKRFQAVCDDCPWQGKWHDRRALATLELYSHRGAQHGDDGDRVDSLIPSESDRDVSTGAVK